MQGVAVVPHYAVVVGAKPHVASLVLKHPTYVLTDLGGFRLRGVELAQDDGTGRAPPDRAFECSSSVRMSTVLLPLEAPRQRQQQHRPRQLQDPGVVLHATFPLISLPTISRDGCPASAAVVATNGYESAPTNGKQCLSFGLRICANEKDTVAVYRQRSAGLLRACRHQKHLQPHQCARNERPSPGHALRSA